MVLELCRHSWLSQCPGFQLPHKQKGGPGTANMASWNDLLDSVGKFDHKSSGTVVVCGEGGRRHPTADFNFVRAGSPSSGHVDLVQQLCGRPAVEDALAPFAGTVLETTLQGLRTHFTVVSTPHDAEAAIAQGFPRHPSEDFKCCIVVVLSASRPWALEAELSSWMDAIQSGQEVWSKAVSRPTPVAPGASAPSTPHKKKQHAVHGADLVLSLRHCQEQRWETLDAAASGVLSPSPAHHRKAATPSTSTPGEGRGLLFPVVVALVNASTLTTVASPQDVDRALLALRRECLLSRCAFVSLHDGNSEARLPLLSRYVATLLLEGLSPWSQANAAQWREASTMEPVEELFLPHGVDTESFLEDMDVDAAGGKRRQPLWRVFGSHWREAVEGGREPHPEVTRSLWVKPGGAALYGSSWPLAEQLGMSSSGVAQWLQRAAVDDMMEAIVADIGEERQSWLREAGAKGVNVAPADATATSRLGMKVLLEAGTHITASEAVDRPAPTKGKGVDKSSSTGSTASASTAAAPAAANPKAFFDRLGGVKSTRTRTQPPRAPKTGAPEPAPDPAPSATSSRPRRSSNSSTGSDSNPASYFMSLRSKG
jgi:hypothetical protein